MADSSSSGGNAGGGSFDGKIVEWPKEQSLNICNVPIDEKVYVRYVATEWFKNQTITNPRQQSIDAINNARILYQQLAHDGYMDPS